VGWTAEQAVEEAVAALRRGDADEALSVLAPCLDGDPSAQVLEIAGRAHYVRMAYPDAIESMEAAYAAYRASGDAVGAVRVARTIAPLYGTVLGDWAVGGGWLARAQRVLDDTGDAAERGWVALNLGLFEGDRAQRNDRFDEALQLARLCGDPDLEVTALAYLGASLVHTDRADLGMRLLDEALAAIAGSEVDDFCVIEEVFCQLFSACEHINDVDRADQWIAVGEAIARRRDLPMVAAFCRTHYGGVLTAAGRWQEADRTLSEAIRLWDRCGRSGLRAGAIVRLADLRVRQGRVEEAERLLGGLDDVFVGDALRPAVGVLLAKGDVADAVTSLEAAIAATEVERAAAPLLDLLVQARIHLGDLDGANAAIEQLSTCVDCGARDDLAGLLAVARGRVAAAVGDGVAAAGWFGAAAAAFGRARMPADVAAARLHRAEVLAAVDPSAAIADARRAHEAFVALDAPARADRAAAVLRSLGVSTPARASVEGLLSKRELEVLELLGHGLSNPEIAERLYISRKTVEHHVGNVLTKLGLRGRAEAAAYAVRASLPTDVPGGN
jgi:DNA-binding CsgD family transcriptional regulator